MTESERAQRGRCRGVCRALAGAGEEELLDQNQLQTALNTAIASEDYALAGRLRDRLKGLLGDAGSSQGLPGDWQSLGILDWLAERAERLGYRFPTGTGQFPLQMQASCVTAPKGPRVCTLFGNEMRG